MTTSKIGQLISHHHKTVQCLQAELAREEDRLQQLLELAEKQNQCEACQSMNIDHTHDWCGWCEDCGAVYAYRHQQVTWVRPHRLCQDVFSDLSIREEMELNDVWYNEAWEPPTEKNSPAGQEN